MRPATLVSPVKGSLRRHRPSTQPRAHLDAPSKNGRDRHAPCRSVSPRTWWCVMNNCEQTCWWREPRQEGARLPHQRQSSAGVQMVSYAMPAAIACGCLASSGGRNTGRPYSRGIIGTAPPAPAMWRWDSTRPAARSPGCGADRSGQHSLAPVSNGNAPSSASSANPFVDSRARTAPGSRYLSNARFSFNRTELRSRQSSKHASVHGCLLLLIDSSHAPPRKRPSGRGAVPPGRLRTGCRLDRHRNSPNSERRFHESGDAAHR